jgi:hypothetical protein
MSASKAALAKKREAKKAKGTATREDRRKSRAVKASQGAGR